ncbi:transposase [Bacteroides xylanisolvens]|nr:transposase [Bacteroides xylanisolvens]
MVQIFTRKGCHVYACNAFLNHVHILVEIPSPTDFAKIINKVKKFYRRCLSKISGICGFFRMGAGLIRLACHSMI